MHLLHFQKLIEFIDLELEKDSFPGAGVIVTQNGNRLFERYWGTYCSHVQRANPLDARVSHMLYSFSKGISSTVIMIAHQKKLIDYDAPLNAYIPEYRGGWKDATTIRHLLTHSAGIPRCPLAAVYTQEEWCKGIAAACSASVEWEPESKTEYHAASALFLAAEAVRRTMDMATWDEICREFLFTPLGAESLTFRIPSDSHIAITPQPKELPSAIDTASFSLLGHPGGGCFGRLEDMIKVLELHLGQGVWNGKQLIRKEELAEMHRIQYEERIAAAIKSGSPRVHEPWGLGWLIRRDLQDHWFGFGQSTCPQTFGHAGIDTVLGIGEPERQIAIAFMTTNSPSGIMVHRLRNTVTDLIVEEICSMKNGME